MKLHGGGVPSSASRRTSIAFVAALLLAPGVVRGQQGPAAPERQIRIIPLRNLHAGEAAELIQKLFGGAVKAAADTRSNSVVLLVLEPHVVPPILPQVLELLERLDAAPGPQEAPDWRETKVIRLRHARLDETLEKILQLAVGEVAEFVTDARQNLVVVYGEAKAIAQAQALLTELDQPEATEKLRGSMQVRVVWLLKSETLELAPPPPDLQHAVEELAKLGITGLGVAAQGIVQAIPDGDFQLASQVVLGQKHSTQLTISGRLRERAEKATELRLSITAGEVGGRTKLAQLSTTVIAPPGHPVVLCVTPIDEATSVFIVEVMRR
jgi:hypothetical protein